MVPNLFVGRASVNLGGPHKHRRPELENCFQSEMISLGEDEKRKKGFTVFWCYFCRNLGQDQKRRGKILHLVLIRFLS